MLTHSIRWRLNLWLGFLLLCLLTGFGATIYHLQRVTQLTQIDEELERRIAALSSEVRGGPRDGHPGPADFDFGPGPLPPPRERPGMHPPDEPPSGPRGRFGEPPRGGPREMRFGP